jgi:hypothetical protein
MLDVVMDRERVRQDLLEFARRVNREVCVRAADHKPANPDERRWQVQGTVAPQDLDSVRDVVGLVAQL